MAINKALWKIGPYARLRADILSSGAISAATSFDLYDLMSVCATESVGMGYYCTCDKLFQQQVSLVAAVTNMDRRRLTQGLSVETTDGRKEVVKFSFVAEKFHQLSASAIASQFTVSTLVMFSSLVGVGQAQAWKILDMFKGDDAVLYLTRLCASTFLQYNHLVVDLEQLYRDSNSDKLECYGRYNEREGHIQRPHYAERVIDLSSSLRKYYESELPAKAQDLEAPF